MSRSVVELAFLAPIPRGHEVSVSMLRREPESDVVTTLVVDRTSGIVYCGEMVWGLLEAHDLALTNPLAALTRHAWRVESTTEGCVAGAMVSTTSTGRAQTRLVLEH